MTKYIIGEYYSDDQRGALRPVYPLIEYSTEKEAETAIKWKSLHSNRSCSSFGVIEVSR